MIQKFLKPSLAMLFAGAAVAIVALLPTQLTIAQTDSTDLLDDSGKQTSSEEAAQAKVTPLPIDRQKKLVKEIYESTKTVKSAKQLTAMIEKCDDASQAGLSKKRESYVRTLKAWALNRRGESRFEVAKQLQAIGNVAQFQKAFDDAIDDFNDSLSIDTTRHRTFNSRGVAYLFDGQLVLAAKDFTKAVGKKADFAPGYFNRAEALSSMKKFDLAIKDYDTVLSLEPEDAQALTGRAHANLELGNLDLAMTDYDRVVVEYAANGIALINRGDCHEKAGDWKKSLADYSAAKKLGSEDLADQRIAWVLATASDETIRDSKQALALIQPCVRRSDSPTLAMLETLAAAQAAAGQFGDARKSQNKVIALTSGIDQDKSVKKSANVESKSKKTATAAEARLALYVEDKPFVQADKK